MPSSTSTALAGALSGTDYLIRRYARDTSIPFVIAPNGTVTWICDVCQHLIKPTRPGVVGGVIQVNRDACVNRCRELLDPAEYTPLRWTAVHGKCNANPKTTVVYRLGVDQLAHVDHFTRWTKTFDRHEWTLHTDWDRLAAYAADHKKGADR